MSRALSLIHRTDRVLNTLLPRVRETGYLNVYLFHVLFRDLAELRTPIIQPQQRTTVADLRRFLELALEDSVTFVTARQIEAGLPPDGRYGWLTFDDGYAHNARALPVLEELNVPVTLFVSTGHVLEQRCFWNDVLHRELTARGKSPDEIDAIAAGFHFLTPDQIHHRLVNEFGHDALTPRGDLDRPFRADELADFARHPLVELGNHTRDHAVLINHRPADVDQQLHQASDDLEAITGERPVAVSYPIGYHNGAIMRRARAAGLPVGVTVQRRRNRLPLNATDKLRLGRHIVWARDSLRDQLASYSGSWSSYRLARRLLNRDRGGV